MKEIIERLNNLVAVLEEAEGKAEELEIAKVRIGELEAQLVAKDEEVVAKDEEVAVDKARVAELEEIVAVKDSEIATAKAEIERINKENEETRIAELAQLDEAIARLEAIVNK